MPLKIYTNRNYAKSGFIEEGRRKKEEAVIAMVSGIKNVLTVLAVAIRDIYSTSGCYEVQ
jgi:hypothetical protein